MDREQWKKSHLRSWRIDGKYLPLSANSIVNKEGIFHENSINSPTGNRHKFITRSLTSPD